MMNRMKAFGGWILGVALFFCMTGCCSACRAYQKQVRPLVDTEWQLVQLRGNPVHPEGEQFTLLFSADGKLSGMASCNRLLGSYTTSKDRSLTIEPMALTRMFCRDEREPAFIDALSRVTHYEMDGPMLMLLSDGSLVALLEAQTASSETVEQ